MNKTKLIFLFWILILLSKLSTSQNITITRNEPSTLAGGGECVVELTINKGSLAGFAKLQEELPEGLSATAIDTKSASFSFENKKVKFIWMSLPSDGQFKVSYKIKADANASGTKITTGNFYYIEGNDTKKIPIAATDITISSASLATNVPNNSNSGNNTNPSNTNTPSKTPIDSPKVTPLTTSTTSTSGSTSTSTNVVKAQTPPDTSGSNTTSTNTPVKSTTNTSNTSDVVKTSPQTTSNTTNVFPPRIVAGIVYKVQVGAFATDGADWLKSKFNFTDPITTEQIDGLYKCVMGTFSTYAEAKEYRNKLRGTGDDGAFVVSYNNGTRIPVSQALQLTGQIWAFVF